MKWLPTLPAKWWLIGFCLLARLVSGQELPSYEDEVIVDLNNPTFQEGILSTETGGVLTGAGLRIQAQKLTYAKQKDGSYVIAEGDLMLEYGDNVFIGERLEYDFSKREGWVWGGRSALGPWYVGGNLIHLQSDGTILIDNGFLTTCGNLESEWQLQARRVRIRKGGFVSAHFINVRFLRFPVFWLPNFRTNLNWLLDAPIRYRMQIGGTQGSRASLRYRFFTQGNFKAYLRLEYLLTRGPAGGIETEYCTPNQQVQALTQSYAAHDRTVADPKNRFRYRFAGTYYDRQHFGPNYVYLSYDVLSDDEMPSDYRTNDFNLRTARRSQLHIRRQTCNWSGLFYTIPRLNTFQTINQRLPTLQLTRRPYSLGDTGIVFDTRLWGGYHSYVFAKETGSPGFDSGRFEWRQTLYRPLPFRFGNLMPEIGVVGVGYTDSPNGRAKGLVAGLAHVFASLQFSRTWPTIKHLAEPYIDYTYRTSPTVSLPNHFLFTEKDGLVRLNYLRFGIRHHFWQLCGDCARKVIDIDAFAYSFINTPSIEGSIPRIYGRFCAYLTSSARLDMRGAWNVTHREVDHFTARLSQTLSEDAAFSIEYRWNSPFDWRKADRWNFSLDSFQNESFLLNTALSDRRNTLLTHFFIRLAPIFTVELETRYGWQRNTGPTEGREICFFNASRYAEGKIKFQVLLSCGWRLNAYYEHAEADDRFSLGISLGTPRRPCNPGHVTTVW